ncbi:MAG: hypothetical protein ACRELB_20935, partial [Polyangiaceae bacterium]
MLRDASTATALAIASLAGLAGVATACGGCQHEGAPPDTSGATASAGSSDTAPAEHSAADADSADSGPRGTVVHVDDDGKAFDVHLGDVVVFELTRHAGTGFELVPAPTD